MRVLILCGGQGTRLAPVLGGLPKALAPIHGRPFLDYQLEALYRAGFVEIVPCIGVGYDAIDEPCSSIHRAVKGDGAVVSGALRHAHTRHGRRLGDPAHALTSSQV